MEMKNRSSVERHELEKLCGGTRFLAADLLLNQSQEVPFAKNCTVEWSRKSCTFRKNFAVGSSPFTRK